MDRWFLPQLPFIWLLVLSSGIHGYLKEEPMYPKLYNCLEMETRNMTVEDFPAAGIMHSCVQGFLASTHHLRHHHNVSSEELAWIRSLVRKYVSSTRHKRQSDFRRVRQEIRRLTDQQRSAVFAAFNVLKQSGRYDTLASFHQAMALVSAHNGPNFLSWHRIYLLAMEEALIEVDPTVTLPYWDSTIDFDMGDPLQSIVWSSAFFGNNDGVVNSGPFANWVAEGGGLLTRNAGSFGTSLMQKRLVNNIINPNNNVRFHWQITVWYGQRPWLRGNILERQHDGAHSWVGGLMRGLSTAAFDPVFFFHHCYVDYVWEQFRIKQRNLGIDSSNDYLPDFYYRDRPTHFRNRVMDGFPDYTNIDGYDDRFTRDIYTFEQAPNCPCGSPYMYCDVARRTCVSADRSAMGEMPSSAAGFGGMSIASLAAQANGPLALGETFTSSFADPRARNKPLPSGPRVDGAGTAFGAFTDAGTGTGTNIATNLLRRASTRGALNFNNRVALINMLRGSQNQASGLTSVQRFAGPLSINRAVVMAGQNRLMQLRRQNSEGGMSQSSIRGMTLGAREAHMNNRRRTSLTQRDILPQPNLVFPANMGISSAINQGIQNTFTLDGISDIKRWAFMPIRVVHRRARGSVFDGDIVVNGQIKNGVDMYNPTVYSQMQRYMQRGRPATYPKCPKYGSGAEKIFIETNGINYAGTFKDYAMIDSRQPVTEAFTYVGFRNPSLGVSRIYVHAYDSHGRVCQPRCMVPRSNPPRYVPCSGAIRATTSTPMMYGNTFGEAVLGRWDFKSNYCPKSFNGEVFMTFYCDYSKGWPWRDCKKG